MKHFRTQCTLRVIAIGMTMWAGTYLLLETTSYMATGIVGFFVVIQLAGLVTYVEKTNQDLGRFLRSVRYSDFSQTFTSGQRGKSFHALSEAFSAVMDDFRKTRSEKEEHYRYLQTVVQHVGIGLISFKQDGTVGLVNNAAKRLLRVTHLKNIKALASFDKALVGLLLQMGAGEKALFKASDDEEMLELSIYATTFRMQGEQFTLVSLQNIQSELEEKEIEAWQKLTRVLTHEIMNSITPIASLTATVNELLQEVEVTTLAEGESDVEVLMDVQGALQTIERRSQHLLHFVQAYRSLTRIPRPNLEIVPVRQLFDDISQLQRPQVEALGIRFDTHIDPVSLDLTADPHLIEQVLINLVKNAMEAVQGLTDGEIRLLARIDDRGRTIIQVSDNGPGIVPEALDKIFIPFFTTRKEGSGIGLSFSRQIMRQHGGTLTVFSEPDIRTVFTLRF